MGFFHDDAAAAAAVNNIGLNFTRISRCRYAYEKLTRSSSSDAASADRKSAAKPNNITEMRNRRPRPCWVMIRTTLVRSGGGRSAGLIKLIIKKGLRLSRSRKLTLKPFSAMVFPNIPSRISRIYDDIVEKMKNMDPLYHSYPHIIFSAQWGLPVLSHPVPIAKCMRYY